MWENIIIWRKLAKMGKNMIKWGKLEKIIFVAKLNKNFEQNRIFQRIFQADFGQFWVELSEIQGWMGFGEFG